MNIGLILENNLALLVNTAIDLKVKIQGVSKRALEL
jgi:hypothetical protein